jgi:hypothetical protein
MFSSFDTLYSFKNHIFLMNLDGDNNYTKIVVFVERYNVVVHTFLI